MAKHPLPRDYLSSSLIRLLNDVRTRLVEKAEDEFANNENHQTPTVQWLMELSKRIGEGLDKLRVEEE